MNWVYETCGFIQKSHVYEFNCSCARVSHGPDRRIILCVCVSVCVCVNKNNSSWYMSQQRMLFFTLFWKFCSLASYFWRILNTTRYRYYKHYIALGLHDDVIKWKHFPRCMPFVRRIQRWMRGIHRLPVNSPHKGQWRGALIFLLICAWTNDCVNTRDAGDLRCHYAHYDVTVMM